MIEISINKGIVHSMELSGNLPQLIAESGSILYQIYVSISRDNPKLGMLYQKGIESLIESGDIFKLPVPDIHNKPEAGEAIKDILSVLSKLLGGNNE